MELGVTKMKTKKILVGYDPAKPDKNPGDFLVVVFESSQPCFLGLRSQKLWHSGRMVYIGKEITEKDIFAKLIETGRRIEDVDQTLKVLETYLTQLQNYRIGNVLTIKEDSSGEYKFRLVKTAEVTTINAAVRKLP